MLLDKDQELENALKAVEEIEPDFEQACKDYFSAKAEAKIAEKQAYLNAEGTIQAREATAVVKTAEQIRDLAGKQAVYEFLKEKLADRQEAVSARQSLLSASVKTNKAF
jgi:hypothetical protein